VGGCATSKACPPDRNRIVKDRGSSGLALGRQPAATTTIRTSANRHLATRTAAS
jgi:hypothetical protein